MSLALLDRRDHRRLRGVASQERSLEGGRHGLTERAVDGRRPAIEDGMRTLDELVSTAWSGLVTREAVCCPSCKGRMVARADPSGGDCVDCGASLF